MESKKTIYLEKTVLFHMAVLWTFFGVCVYFGSLGASPSDVFMSSHMFNGVVITVVITLFLNRITDKDMEGLRCLFYELQGGYKKNGIQPKRTDLS